MLHRYLPETAIHAYPVRQDRVRQKNWYELVHCGQSTNRRVPFYWKRIDNLLIDDVCMKSGGTVVGKPGSGGRRASRYSLRDALEKNIRSDVAVSIPSSRLTVRLDHQCTPRKVLTYGGRQRMRDRRYIYQRNSIIDRYMPAIVIRNYPPIGHAHIVSHNMLAILRRVLFLYRIGEGVNEVPYEDARPHGVNGQAVSRRFTIWPKWTMGLP